MIKRKRIRVLIQTNLNSVRGQSAMHAIDWRYQPIEEIADERESNKEWFAFWLSSVSITPNTWHAWFTSAERIISRSRKTIASIDFGWRRVLDRLGRAMKGARSEPTFGHSRQRRKGSGKKESEIWARIPQLTQNGKQRSNLERGENHTLAW